MRDIIRTLRTLNVDGEPVVLDCTPATAQRVWFNEVPHRDHTKFELVVEPFGAASCKVHIENVENESVFDNGFLCFVLSVVGVGLCLISLI